MRPGEDQHVPSTLAASVLPTLVADVEMDGRSMSIWTLLLGILCAASLSVNPDPKFRHRKWYLA